VITELRVANLGIIEELLVPLGPGMTAITGETGAGKTLLVEALDLLLGGRADAGLVRSGADEARVEARVVTSAGPVGDTDDVEEIVLARVVPAVGRSRAYVNGRLAAAGELATLARELVDLHGQHDHQSLLQPAVQRALLDRFAGDDAAAARAEIARLRARRRAVDQDLDALGGDERARAREADLLRYQLVEIETAAITDLDEEAQLERDERLLADAEEHRRALSLAHDTLDGAALDAIGAALEHLRGREPFAPLAARLHATQDEVAEVARDARVEAEAIVADPERLDVVRARRHQLRELCRKYGATPADVLAYAQEAAAHLHELDSRDARAAELGAERDDLERRLGEACTVLRRLRREGAPTLSRAVEEHLRELAMPAAAFDVAVTDAAPGDDGADEVSFLLAANPGEDLRPLARAASGGELSRAMLALRVVLSEAPPTLVFDEVDAGIGGEAGFAVGRALATLGGKHQVLCVTHLPQVAAFADAQVVVSKRAVGDRTIAAADLVLDDARVGELSRMLAGVGESTHARRHARELLDAARRVRSDVRS
jgi:DNA repair protein RecN (Recombination protein N)